MLKVLRDGNEPIKVRLAALQALQAASFSVLAFEACRGDYIATLREVADDPDPELRQRVLGILTREKDGSAQKKLLEGLHDPTRRWCRRRRRCSCSATTCTPTPMRWRARSCSKPPNEAARARGAAPARGRRHRRAAVREDAARQGRAREIRQIAASALHALKPDRMQKHAREILLDKSDYDDIQATSLTALTQFGDEKTLSDDKAC